METTAQNAAYLRTEGERLHASIFGTSIPEPVLQKYIEAHLYYLTSPENSEVRWMSEAVRRGLDLEALEIALRFSHSGHLLVRKVKILVHIAEGFDAYRSWFINEKPRRAKAVVLLVGHLFQTGFKFLKGKFLLWRLKDLV